MAERDIYEPAFVARLFDEMSATYGITNWVSSFAFCQRWRRQCVEGVTLEPGLVVLDLMTGMGECWRFVADGMDGDGEIVAVDLSPEMCRRARENTARVVGARVRVSCDDALDPQLPDACADRVVSSFGLKTFSSTQLGTLARQIARLLKPGGTFSLVEISVPRSRLLRVPYLWYLRHVIPHIGRVFLGNPDNYRWLSVYTERFAAEHGVVETLRGAGLEVEVDELFFGCARRFRGSRPAMASEPIHSGPG